MRPSDRPGSSRLPMIILIDGDCSMCRNMAAWALRRSPRRRLRIVTRQSAAGRRLIAEQPAGALPADTVACLDNGRIRLHADAVRQVVRRLHPPWSWLVVLTAVPRPLRDAAYRWLARRRGRRPATTDCRTSGPPCGNPTRHW